MITLIRFTPDTGTQFGLIRDGRITDIDAARDGLEITIMHKALNGGQVTRSVLSMSNDDAKGLLQKLIDLGVYG